MTDLNRKEDSPIMKTRRELEKIILEEEWNFSPNESIIKRCKAEIKSIDEMLERLELKG